MHFVCFAVFFKDFYVKTNTNIRIMLLNLEAVTHNFFSSCQLAKKIMICFYDKKYEVGYVEIYWKKIY